VATQTSNSKTAIFRSYDNPKQPQTLFDECKVWEACRATSAAPTFFDSIKIGKYGQLYIDGGLGYNNPVQLVYNEAKDIWPSREIQILSVGTGVAPSKKFEGNLYKIVQAMKELVSRSDETADVFDKEHKDLSENGGLFRFRVDQDLGTIGLAEHREVPAMASATQSYLNKGEITRKLHACAEKLRGDTGPHGTAH
jgi:predicted acylesterase/phospholipase RssA